jgi:hypothetical protein
MAKCIQWKKEKDPIAGAEERIASPQDRYPNQDHEIPEKIQRAFDDGAIPNEY